MLRTHHLSRPLAGLVVSTHFNADFKEKYRAFGEAGKPSKVAVTAIMRKLTILASAVNHRLQIEAGRPQRPPNG
jgi:transposase